MENLSCVSQEIFSSYQTRKTKKQKLAFIEFLKGYYADLKVEKGGIITSRNIVFGDVDNAKIIVTAHYDTCALLPFPNFITPKNILFYIFYNLIIAGIILFAFGVISYFTAKLIPHPIIAPIIPLLFLLAFMYMLICGKPSKNTANDNTSGVITLLETMNGLAETQKQDYAFVLFDNEESGLFGSAFFQKRHKKQIKDTLIVNLDCVSDGDNIMVVQNKKARKLFGQQIQEAFVTNGEKNILLTKASTTIYPSDQICFSCNVAVASLKRKPIIGYYMDKIHTKHDMVFDVKNIILIKEAILNLQK